MSDQDAFDQILASLYEAMLDDTLWPTTSALIEEACGTKGTALLVEAGPVDNPQFLFGQGCSRGQDRSEWIREYGEQYYAIDESVPRVRQLPDSRVVHITELYTTEELKTSPTYNEALRRYGSQDGLNVHLAGPDGSHITWALADPVTPGGWAAPQLALLKGLLPHIRQFIRVRQTLVNAEALSTSVTDLLDTTRIGVIQLDRQGRIIEANDRARHILRHGDGLSDRGGELRVRTPADQERFGQLLAGALPTSNAVAVSGSMTLRRTSMRPSFVVHVKPVVAPQPDFGAQRVAALVLLVEPGHQSRLDPGLVAETLGLTLTESQIAIWMAEGRSVREIAAATGRRPDSIRWHLKQIYHKQGLAGQADLVRLLLSLTEFV